VPLVLLGIVKATRTSPPWVGLASLSVVLGFIAVRLNIVIPALALPTLKGLAEAFLHPRLSPYYFPTPTEWLASVGVIGLGLIFFSLGYSLLPLQSES